MERPCVLVALLLITLVLCTVQVAHLASKKMEHLASKKMEHLASKKMEPFALNEKGTEAVCHGSHRGVCSKSLAVDKAKVGTLDAGTINLSRNMNMTSRSSSIMHGGRLHVAPQERMYLMPKKGVHVSKAWGGSGDLSVAGTTSLNGQLTMAGRSNTIRAGRLHVAPSERLYLLPKKGVHIAKAWGSSGDLTVAGTTMLDGPTTWMNNLSSRGRMHVHPNERLYLLPRKGVHLAKAWGSTGDLSVQGNTSLGKLNAGPTNIRSLGVTSNTMVNRNLDVKGGTNLRSLGVKYDAKVNRNLSVRGNTNIARNLGVRGQTNTRSLAVAYDTRVNRNLNVAGVTRTRTLTATQDANVKRNLAVSGITRINGDLRMTNRKASTIDSAGRLHVAPSEKLYLLPKKGVHVSKAWGGTGNLDVEGNTALKGDLNMENGRKIRSKGRLHVVTNDALYLLPRKGVHVAKKDGGSGNLSLHGRLCLGNTCITEGDMKKFKSF